ncbi:MAG: DNA polymerase I [Spirochaetia bacterium]
MKEPLYLLDGYSLIYRSYFAFIRNPLRNPAGQNVSAIYGFFRSIFLFMKERNPVYFGIVFDSKTPTFRHEMYEPYKQNREKAPDDLISQIPVIEEILETLDLITVRQNGYEADDIIATLSELCRQENRECYILSGDKDLLQLVDGPVKVLKPEQGSFTLLGPAEVKESWLVEPSQIVDYLSLIGDSSDNVPGVRGVGPKTASKLLNDFGTLENLYANIGEAGTPAQRKKLEDGRENAFLSKSLIELKRDVPLELGVDQYGIKGLNGDDAVPLFLREGMKSLVDEMKGLPGISVDRQAAKAAESEANAEAIKTRTKDIPLEILGDAGGAAKSVCRIIETEEDLDRLIREVKERGCYAFDCETNSLDEMAAVPVGFSISTEPGKAAYIPMVCPEKIKLGKEIVREKLKLILEDPGLTLIGQNLKYDYKVLFLWGIEMARISFDTMIAAWVLDATANTYGLDALAERILGYKKIKYDDIVPKGSLFSNVPLASAAEYGAEDADIAFRLYLVLQQMLTDRNLLSLFCDIEMPLVKILADMEIRGIGIDADVLHRFREELFRRVSGIEEEIFRQCGKTFNIASTKQLQEVLFQDRKLRPVKKTKTGYSTDTAVLMELAREDVVPEMVLNHRTLSKLISTYADALPKLINTNTCRIHTHFIQTGTATGRLSSKDPNLQNIPIREEEGRKIRSAFIASEGKYLLSADYSQIELVILAHLSGDPELSRAFREGGDIHRRTAALLFGTDEESVTPDLRRIAKTINFGVMYGMSAYRLSQELGIPRKDASSFIKEYFSRYSGIKAFIEETVRQAEITGSVKTIFGRERSIPAINNRNKTVKAGAERVAVNTPIQGSAADIVKRAMILVRNRIEKEKSGARLLLQVHDELILEVPKDEIKVSADFVREEMMNAAELDIPLRVNVEYGESWGSFH